MNKTKKMGEDENIIIPINNRMSLLPTREGLSSYYYYQCGIPEDMIQRISSWVTGKSLQEGNVTGSIDSTYRRSRIRWIPLNSQTQGLYDELLRMVKDTNEKFFGFHLTNLLEMIQYTEYDAEYEGFYDWHMDVGGGFSSKRKLSLSIQLSGPEEYEGGELEIMLHRNIHTMEKSKGTVILFPSYLMHRVRPVTKGKRRALILWIHGPPFQ